MNSNTDNSGSMKWQHIFDHLGPGVQNLLRTKEIAEITFL